MSYILCVRAATWFTLLLLAVTTNAVYLSQYSKCPLDCQPQRSNWTVFSSVGRLDYCDGITLLDFGLYNTINSTTDTIKIRSCLAQNGTAATTQISSSNFSAVVMAPVKRAITNSTSVPVSISVSNSTCTSSRKSNPVSLSLTLTGAGAALQADIQSTVQQLSNYIDAGTNGCNRTFLFGRAPNLAVGIYSGAGLDTSTLVQSLSQIVSSSPGGLVLELCDPTRSADFVFGAVINTDGDIGAAQ